MAEPTESKLLALRKWREVVEKVSDLIKEMYPEVEIYLIGGAAEGRLTILSDIDMVIVIRNKQIDRAEMLANIWEAMEKILPMWYPIEIHILTRDEFRRLHGKKVKLS